MKVLMLGWELPPHNSGGLGTACYEMCKRLAQNDVDIEFILPYQAEHNIDFMKVRAAVPLSPEKIAEYGNIYESHKFSKTINNLSTTSDQHWRYEQAVLGLAESRTFDIVHAHDWLTFRAALRLKERHGWPIILHVHSIESDRAGAQPGNPLVHEIEDTALHLADKVIAVSDQTKRAIMRDYGLQADTIAVVHNSLNVNELAPLDDQNVYRYLEFMKTKGYKVVTNAGRLTIQKGIPNLLKALKKVIEVYPKTLALIAGNGDQQYELMTLAASIGIGANVLFTDFQRGKKLRDTYAIGDLFVLPSVAEPFGLTPLESIAYGTPALVSKQSGVSEVIRNVLKVDFWDIDEMANQISGVLMNQPLAEELERNSYEELKSMSWQQASDKVIGIYNQNLLGTLA